MYSNVFNSSTKLILILESVPIPKIPLFLKCYPNDAYQEGWALYCENLGKYKCTFFHNFNVLVKNKGRIFFFAIIQYQNNMCIYLKKGKII